MRLLVLGGTVFLGRHVVDAARTAGHDVTIVHRGVHPAHRDDVTRIVADRDGDLAPLKGQTWDAAIDVAAYLPRTVITSTALLRAHVERYVFVSTRSVYKDMEKGVVESSPLATIDDATAARFDAMSTDGLRDVKEFWPAYGPLKARCESIVRDAFGDRALVVRPGLIGGPHDPTDRFIYWPSRITRGGEVLCPDRPETPTRLIDVRDLAAWIVRATETAANGTFDAIGPKDWTLGRVIDACKSNAKSDARLTWVDESFLLDRKVEPWSDLPCWLPRKWAAGFTGTDDRAQHEGLTFRSLEDTVRDTMAWDRARSPGPRKNGLDAARESELLAAWHARAK
jgi:2'-hydroxyisoflavone reductase